MTEPPSTPPQPSNGSDTAPSWWNYFPAVLALAAGGFISYFYALLSMNVVILAISVATTVGCLLLLLIAAINEKVLLAYFFAIGNIPIAIGIAFLHVFFSAIEVRLPENPLGPNAALERAVTNGEIRMALMKDVQAFKDAYLANKYSKNGLPIPATEDSLGVSKVELSRAFVVRKEFHFPSGMTGKDSAVFFLPRGVPMPSGEIGHSAIYDFATLTVSCTGARAAAEGLGLLSC